MIYSIGFRTADTISKNWVSSTVRAKMPPVYFITNFQMKGIALLPVTS